MVRMRWFWLVIPGLGWLELGAHHYFAQRAPTIAEWQAEKPFLMALRQHSEPVMVAPYWAEPMARFAFGAEAFPVTELARPDESAFFRAIEISILGQHAPELTGWQLKQERHQGRFTLRLLENPHPAEVRWDFWSELRPSTVTVFQRGPEGVEDCPYVQGTGSTGSLLGHVAFPASRFQCLGGPSAFVGRTIVEDQNYRPRRCLWASPPRLGTLVVRFANVRLGQVIRGYGGVSWFLGRDGGHAPVELEARVNGLPVGTLNHREEQGWYGFEFPTPHAAGDPASVEFRIRSEPGEHRDFCFWADTR